MYLNFFLCCVENVEADFFAAPHPNGESAQHFFCAAPHVRKKRQD